MTAGASPASTTRGVLTIVARAKALTLDSALDAAETALAALST